MNKASLKKIVQDTSLRTKITFIFFILLIVPFSLFILYSSRRTQNVIQQQALTSTHKTFNETLLSLDALLEKMDMVSDMLSKNTLLYVMVTANPETYSSSQQYTDYLTLSSSFTQLQALSGVDNIRLYFEGDYLYTNSKQYFYSLDNIIDSHWYQKLTNLSSKRWFTPSDFLDQPSDDQAIFSLMRPLYTSDSYKAPSAVLRVDIAQSTFMESLNYTDITKNCTMLLLTEEDVLLSSTHKNDFPVEKILASLPAISPNQWETITLGREKYFILCETLDINGWKLAAFIPYSDVTNLSRRLSMEMICVMILLASIAYGFALSCANFILKRIHQLSDAMTELENGTTDIQLNDPSKDEIGQLTISFNHMVKHLNQLMDEKVQYGLAIKNLELKALQAQINPHFLYNTLDTINCLSIQNNVPQITDAVSALASFYRIGLSKGEDNIKLRDEISHAQMYLKILNIRFSDQIHTVWEIAPEIEDLHIIKMILQPIIENAAIHGIYERENGRGAIKIRGWQEEEHVYLTVEDDGVGMPQEVIAANFSPASQEISDMPGGYGIRNICDRIHIAYGAQYGLSCKSKMGVGSTVTIHIPRCP